MHYYSDRGYWAAQKEPVGRASLKGGDSDAHASERRMGAVLRASVLVVLEAAVPRYACCGWVGLSDEREGTSDPPTERRSGGVWGSGSGAGRRSLGRSPSA